MNPPFFSKSQNPTKNPTNLLREPKKEKTFSRQFLVLKRFFTAAQNGTRLQPTGSTASGRLASDSPPDCPHTARFSSIVFIHKQKDWPISQSLVCAQNGTRTHTPLRELGPEPSASTNSAIWACCSATEGNINKTAGSVN